MRRLLLWIIFILILSLGCSSQEVFVESKEIKDFPIPKEAELIGDVEHNHEVFQYNWKIVRAEAGIPNTFKKIIDEYGWESNAAQNKDNHFYFTKNDRTVCLSIENERFMLSEVEHFPSERDTEGNYILSHEVIFEGHRDNIFFENTLEDNAYDWFMDSIEDIQMENKQVDYYYKMDGNTYEYFIITGGNKINRVYMNDQKTQIVIELVRGQEDEEIQFIKYKLYPEIKKSITKYVQK